MKTYSELITINTFEDRIAYLLLHEKVGVDKYHRELHERFYKSYEWRYARDKAIIRDMCLDLGIPGRDIVDKRSVFVHHIEPITEFDIINRSSKLLDPNNLITTSFNTHGIIHYGSLDDILLQSIERYPGDTTLW